MALQVKMGSTGRKLGDLAVNESIEGYLIGTVETKFNFALKMLSKEGKVETYYPNGNINYIQEEIDNGDVILNAWTKITRTGTRTSTKSRDQAGEYRQVPVFSVAQDDDDIVTDDAAASALVGDKAELAGNADEAPSASGSKFANRKR